MSTTSTTTTTPRPSPSSALSSSASSANEYVLNFAFLSFVGFLSVQAVFALIANSESMLADCQAMAVDAVTYLFNLCAERIKNRPYTDKEMLLSEQERAYKREMLRLYLELIPPTISVATLIAVTILTLREAFHTLWGESDQDDEADVSLPIMMLFSFANLMLDIVNVTCFARANSAFGLDAAVRRRREKGGGEENISTEGGDVQLMKCDPSSSFTDNEPTREEDAPAVTTRNIDNASDPAIDSSASAGGEADGILHQPQSQPNQTTVNLNMCSAWTHVCADTMRSTAVLVAAGIATLIPSIPSESADAVAAIAVSFTILLTLIPLMRGLIMTAIQIVALMTRKEYQLSCNDSDNNNNNNNNNVGEEDYNNIENARHMSGTVI